MWRVNGRAWNYFHAWGTTSQVRSDQQIKLFRLHLSVFQDIFFKKCLDSGSLSTAVRHLNLECLNWLPWWLSGKESACQWRRYGFDPWAGKIPWRKKWQPTPAGSQREELRPWQRSWGRRLGIRKGGIEPQESSWKFSSIYPQNQSLPIFCFVLSPTPLTLWGAVSHYLSLKKELTYRSS